MTTQPTDGLKPYHPRWCICGGSGFTKNYRGGQPIPCIYAPRASQEQPHG